MKKLGKFLAGWGYRKFFILFLVGIMYSISASPVEGIMCSLSFLGLAVVFTLIEDIYEKIDV